jgi:hypothetical protein
MSEQTWQARYSIGAVMDVLQACGVDLGEIHEAIMGSDLTEWPDNLFEFCGLSLPVGVMFFLDWEEAFEERYADWAGVGPDEPLEILPANQGEMVAVHEDTARADILSLIRSIRPGDGAPFMHWVPSMLDGPKEGDDNE